MANPLTTHEVAEAYITNSKQVPWEYCKQCGSTPREHEMRNFDPIGRYADIFCARCGAYVREWDPN